MQMSSKSMFDVRAAGRSAVSDRCDSSQPSDLGPKSESMDRSELIDPSPQLIRAQRYGEGPPALLRFKSLDLSH